MSTSQTNRTSPYEGPDFMYLVQDATLGLTQVPDPHNLTPGSPHTTDEVQQQPLTNQDRISLIIDARTRHGELDGSWPENINGDKLNRLSKELGMYASYLALVKSSRDIKTALELALAITDSQEDRGVSKILSLVAPNHIKQQ